jgi:hypothetical protein
MATPNSGQWAVDLSNWSADQLAVYRNASRLLDEYNDTGLVAIITALPNGSDLVPGMGDLTRDDVTNGINTINSLISDMEAGHRTNLNKIIATHPPTA